MDDFTVNVRQIVQYPRKSALAATDLVLLQESDAQGIAAGAYKSAFLFELLKTAFVNGGVLKFKPDGVSGIAFNGSSMTANANGFQFSTPIDAPAVTIAGQPPALKSYVDELFLELNGSLTNAFSNLVTSFNGRRGDIFLEDVDILRAGGVLQNNAHFHGNVTAPTIFPPTSSTENIATTEFVQRAICYWLMHSPLVQSFNGRIGVITLTADDITAAATALGAQPRTNTPPLGDASTRIANTMFVDETVNTVVQDIHIEISNLGNSVIDFLDGNYAPLDSPQFVGIPTGPTASPGSTTGQLATTAFVMNAVTGATAGVASFNTRTGAVTLITADITGAGGAPIASPVFSGTPAAPTATAGTATTQIATTKFVMDALTLAPGGVSSFNGRTGAITLTTPDITGAGGAPLTSPALTGTPTAPTATGGTNTTQIATTAFVMSAVAAATAGVASFNGRTGAVTLLGNDISAAGGAMSASPALTGIPTAPTAAPGTNTNQLATTAYVQAAAGNVVSSFNGRGGAVTLTTGDVTGAGGAPLSSPAFTGTPSAPTPPQATNDTTLATTAYVRSAIGSATGVASFNGRTGAVTLTGADLTAAGGALLASPNFTGTPQAPLAAPGTISPQIATCQFVMTAIGNSVTAFNGRTGSITMIANDITAAGGALTASPSFSGTPLAPTPTTGTNNTQIATTAFVYAAMAALGGVTYKQQDTAPSLTNTFWFDSIRGQLYVAYTDPSSSAQTWVVANAPLATAGYTANNYPGPGSFTFTTPTNSSPTTIYRVRLQAAGGGGARGNSTSGQGGGGGAGEFKEFTLSGFQPSAVWNLVLGSPGTGSGVDGGLGNNATDTTLTAGSPYNLSITCKAGKGGGQGGYNFTVGGPGGGAGAVVPGSATFGQLPSMDGQAGAGGGATSAGMIGSDGGDSALGRGGRMAWSSNFPGNAPTGYGAGGAGSCFGYTNPTAMTGGNAYCVIERIAG